MKRCDIAPRDLDRAHDEPVSAIIRGPVARARNDTPKTPSALDHFRVLGRRLAVPLGLPLGGVTAALDAALSQREPKVMALLQIARRARRLRAESIDAALTPVALRVALRVRGGELPSTGVMHTTVKATFGVPLALQNETFVTVPAPGPDAPCLPAAATLALEWLARVRSMEAESVTGLEPEGPHQLRVGVRRLRTVLRLLERHPGAGDLGAVVTRVRALGDLAGTVRDHDVVLARITTLRVSDAARDRAVRHVNARRRRALARLQRVLCAPGVSASIESARAALEIIAQRPDERHLDDGARELLDRSFKQFARQCSQAIPDGEAYHALRRRIRRVRDCVEVFGPLLRRQDHAWRKRLQPVQTMLGDLNDIETSLRFVPASLAGAAPVREALDRQRLDLLAELGVPLMLTVLVATRRA